MFNICLIIIIMLIQIATSLSLGPKLPCKLDVHILTPIITYGGTILKPADPNAIETIEIPFGEKILLTCDPGKFYNSTEKTMTAYCQGDDILKINGLDQSYLDMECNFYDEIQIKEEPIGYCSKDRQSFRFGVVRPVYNKTAILGELCFDESGLFERYHIKMQRITGYNCSELMPLATENSDYFKGNLSLYSFDGIKNRHNLSDENVVQKLKNNFRSNYMPSLTTFAYIDLKHDPFATAELYFGNYDINKTGAPKNGDFKRYMWFLFKHNQKVVIFVITTPEETKRMCVNRCDQIVKKMVPQPERISIQCCEYYDLKGTLKELPDFDGKIEFII